MLGPSFSPSITRIPGPTSSHSRRNLEKTPRWARASDTRTRSWARSTSSWVITTSSWGLACGNILDRGPKFTSGFLGWDTGMHSHTLTAVYQMLLTEVNEYFACVLVLPRPSPPLENPTPCVFLRPLESKSHRSSEI